MVTLANWEWFSKWEDGKMSKRGEDYDSIKNAIGDKMWEQCLWYFPHLKDKVNYEPLNSDLLNSDLCPLLVRLLWLCRKDACNVAVSVTKVVVFRHGLSFISTVSLVNPHLEDKVNFDPLNSDLCPLLERVYGHV